MSDPVLDAYVAEHGAKPTSYTHGVEWKIRLRIWRSAWQEATLIEREACVAACEEERLVDNTGESEDVCYERAITDCQAAIRARTKP